MEELNSWWARGGGGFAWFRLVKCRKVHKETLVLFPSVSQRLNKVQFCQINQKTLTEKVQQLPVELQMCRCDAGWTRPVRPRLQSLPCIPVRARLWGCGRLLCVRFMCLSLEWRRVEAVDSLGDWQKSRRLQEKVEKVETSLQKVRLTWGGKQRLCFRWERLD